ncbi:MAG TPA: DUF1598 domain-containing protein [Planctomicrobium sp.]|nr:DUF1598 domain-containing protein [Planctomicrobium sp.]
MIRIVPHCLFVCLTFISVAQAQFFPGPGNNNNFPGSSGILINAEGVIELRQVSPATGAAWKKQAERFAGENLPPEIVVTTPQRVLSLKNLATAIQDRVEKQQPLPLEITFLAGLHRIDTIAFDVDAKDIYLIGPADAFAPDATGRMIARSAGRPVLRLDDLVTVLRAGDEQSRSGIGCSIDPTSDNMSRLQEFLRLNSTPATAAQVQLRFRQMANVLGPQEISIWGVPANSHFAAALVEADLRMKRIAMGMESAGVPGIKSHLSMLKPQGNSLQRWWFVPMYDPLETNPERTVFHLKGQRAKLLAQEEFTDARGNRSDSALTRQSTEKFAQLFTENFQALANRSPSFGELQNLYDIAVSVALIKQEAPRHQLSDVLTVYLNEERLTPATYAIPRTVPSSSTFRSTGTGVMLGLVGGVTIDTGSVLRSSPSTPTTSGEAPASETLTIQNIRDQVRPEQFFSAPGVQ